VFHVKQNVKHGSSTCEGYVLMDGEDAGGEGIFLEDGSFYR
jgi:hypothetical protein